MDLADLSRFVEDIKDQAFRLPEIETPGFYSAIVGLFHAVDFSEPWIIGLLSVHLALLLLVLCFQNRLWVQATTLILICGLVRSAEWLNQLAGRNWRSFATQNYFDPSGVFAGIMFSGPLLGIGFVQLVRVFHTGGRWCEV